MNMLKGLILAFRENIQEDQSRSKDRTLRNPHDPERSHENPSQMDPDIPTRPKSHDEGSYRPVVLMFGCIQSLFSVGGWKQKH